MTSLQSEPLNAPLDCSELLAPLRLDDFITDHWQLQPLHLSGRGGSYYSGLFSLDELEGVLPAVERLPLLVNIANYQRQSAVPSSDVHRRYLDGDTIVVNYVQRRSRTVNALCRSLEEFFHFPVTANAYLTPPHTTGFRVHYDNHDVFVLQIEGEKQWDIWPPVVQFPLNDTQEPVPRDLQTPTTSVCLRSGDLLYVPRGFIHQARAVDLASLHLSIGVTAFVLLDLLAGGLRALARRTLDLRRALPIGCFGPQHLAGIDSRSLSAELTRLIQSIDFDEAVNELAADFYRLQSPSLDSHFRSLQSMDEVSELSILRRHTGTVCSIQEEGGSVALRFADRLVRLPRTALEALRFIAASEMFAVAALPGLDSGSRLLLARRLIRDGLLSVMDA